MLPTFYILSASHKEIPLDEVSQFAIRHDDAEGLQSQLQQVKNDAGLDELFYLATCNRVEYVFVTGKEVTPEVLQTITGKEQINSLKLRQGEDAIFYLFQVASSIHSMVVGEREIITQIRTAYEQQVQWDLSGDLIRIAVQQTIKAAKGVYAKTKIGEKPVSVVSLAVRQLLDRGMTPDKSLVLVGAGNTNRLMLRHLTKKGFRNVSIYNRTIESASKLAMQFQLQGKVGNLEELKAHSSGFDCLIACTGSQEPTVDYPTALKISDENLECKVWVDLGLPWDLDPDLHSKHEDQVINLTTLQSLAEENLTFRQKEIKKANKILTKSIHAFRELIHQRRIEKAFIQIPTEIKGIKEKAVTEVFKKELESMDGDTRAVIFKMMDYMEKKCISVPMKLAKEVVL